MQELKFKVSGELALCENCNQKRRTRNFKETEKGLVYFGICPRCRDKEDKN